MIGEGVYKRLPEPLKKLTDEFKNREKDVVLLSCMGVLSNCFPNVYGIYDKDTIYPHLYIVIIAPPASGKGVMTFSRILIEKIHNEIFDKTKTEYLDCEKSKTKPGGDKNKICPSVQVRILPGNVSSAEMYSYLDSCQRFGVVMIESEIETISKMSKNDWSNYSDVLRKVFHHETISISRKTEKIHLNINEPKLAIVLSGTPEQLMPLILSIANGLFSRLLIYGFDEIADFKDVFDKSKKNTKQIFKSVGDDIYSLYHKLMKIEPLEFSLTEIQERRFLKKFRNIQADIVENYDTDFLSSLRRHGLIMFRLCMILTVLRNKDNLQEPLICANKDYAIAESIMKTALRHAQYTFETLENSEFIAPQEEEMLNKLTKTFTRDKAIQVGKEYGVPVRTMDDKLIQWRNKKIIIKISQGKYRKKNEKETEADKEAEVNSKEIKRIEMEAEAEVAMERAREAEKQNNL